MSLSHGSNIVRDGLVLHLDAANVKSYPGSGSTWYDLSGNGNDFTLYNSPTFVNGYLNFSGVNEYASSNSTIDLSPYNAVTVEIVFRANATSTPSGMAFEHSANWNSSPMGFGLVPNSSGSTTYVAGSHHTNQYLGSSVLNYTGVIGTDITMHTNIWTKLASVGGRRAYINTELKGSKDTSSYSDFRNDTFYISARAGTSIFANHRVYSVKIYGKSLSEDEIKQNFEALRGRYGI